MKKPYVLIIAGATAAGKSQLAQELAQHIPAEIINADVAQCYTSLTIGTAKPDWKAEPVPHHLFDSVQDPVDITVVEYRKKIYQLLKTIWARNRLPIIVGGSGFYIASLFFPPKEGLENVADDGSFDGLPADILWEKLHKIDPVRAATIERHDIYRLKRALAIWQATGEKPSLFAPQFEPLCAAGRIIFCTRNKEELHNRINKRTKEMIASGWVQEVEKLIDTPWEPFLLRKKIIGYDDILLFLRHQDQSPQQKEKMIHMISKRTRRYAKRQITFWRMLSQRLLPYISPEGLAIETMNLSSIEQEKYLEHIVTQVRKQVEP